MRAATPPSSGPTRCCAGSSAPASRSPASATSGPSPVEELVDQAEQIVYELAGSETKGDFSIIQDLLHQAFERIAEMAASEGDGVTGLATGFRALDQLLSGFQPSNLVVLAARPSMGKTSLALNIAEHVAVQLRRPVALFSLEMSKAEIAQRLMCSVAGVDQSKLRNGRLANEDWSKVTGAVDTLADAPLFIDDTGSLNVMEIRAKTRRLAQRQGGLGLIVIDYIQLMSAATTTENRVQEVSQISRALKVLGRELNVPVLALSQLSRAVEQRQNKRPMLSDLRESGCLSGDARVFLADSGGYARIADLVGRTVEVLALDPATWRFERRTVRKVFPTGERRVYRMRTQLGRTISATANHRFLTIDGWRRLDELEVGSRIVVPCGLPASGGAESMPEHDLAASAVGLAGARAGVSCRRTDAHAHRVTYGRHGLLGSSDGDRRGSDRAGLRHDRPGAPQLRRRRHRRAQLDRAGLGRRRLHLPRLLLPPRR